MKKVVNRVSYDTSTSTALAVSEDENDDGHDFEDTLYQTQKGAFFVLSRETWGVRDENDEWKERSRITVLPQSIDEAHKWVTTGEVDLLPAGEKIFGGLPVATGATIYLHVPAALKQRIDHVARKANQSVNVWAMRCLESCSSTTAAE